MFLFLKCLQRSPFVAQTPDDGEMALTVLLEVTTWPNWFPEKKLKEFKLHIQPRLG